MSNIDNSGPAFPLPLGTANMAEPFESGGMSLRDYFAAKALQGLLADLPTSLYGLDWKKNTADTAYEFADAMLEARKK